jgi:hypothetical protein
MLLLPELCGVQSIAIRRRLRRVVAIAVFDGDGGGRWLLGNQRRHLVMAEWRWRQVGTLFRLDGRLADQLLADSVQSARQRLVLKNIVNYYL